MGRFVYWTNVSPDLRIEQLAALRAETDGSIGVSSC